MAYLSTVAFYHFLGDVQTKAGTFVAGSEERFKDMRLCFFIDARAIIYNINVRLSYVFIDFPLNMNHDIGRLHVTVIDSIAAQIPQHLM